MPTYIVLFQKTDEGRKITAEDAQQRRAKGVQLSEEFGAEIKGLYYGMGEYEMFAIVDAPDSETMAKINSLTNNRVSPTQRVTRCSSRRSGTVSSKTRSEEQLVYSRYPLYSSSNTVQNVNIDSGYDEYRARIRHQPIDLCV